jgi:hypothetical protein
MWDRTTGIGHLGHFRLERSAWQSGQGGQDMSAWQDSSDRIAGTSPPWEVSLGRTEWTGRTGHVCVTGQQDRTAGTFPPWEVSLTCQPGQDRVDRAARTCLRDRTAATGELGRSAGATAGRGQPGQHSRAGQPGQYSPRRTNSRVRTIREDRRDKKSGQEREARTATWQQRQDSCDRATISDNCGRSAMTGHSEHGTWDRTATTESRPGRSPLAWQRGKDGQDMTPMTVQRDNVWKTYILTKHFSLIYSNCQSLSLG